MAGIHTSELSPGLIEPPKKHLLKRIMERITKAVDFLHGWKPKNASQNDVWQVILPYDVRFAFTHRGAELNPQDGLSLLEERYGFLGVYICLKFFEKNMDTLQNHLQILFQGIKDGKNFREYTQFLRDDIRALPKNVTVLGTKSAQVSRRGFENMCDGVADVFNTSKKEGISILVAFSGLLWAKGIIQDMAPGEVFYIYFPKNPPEDAFLEVHFAENKIQMMTRSELYLKDIFHDAHVVMVDDTRKTGATFDQAVSHIEKFCKPKGITKKTLVMASKMLF